MIWILYFFVSIVIMVCGAIWGDGSTDDFVAFTFVGLLWPFAIISLIYYGINKLL